MGVLHRDIKLDNILIGSDEEVVKICDFGVSRIMTCGKKVFEKCGTPAYIAPEVISDVGYEGFYSDLWSLGILLYSMVSGTVPFKATCMKDLHKLILSGVYNVPQYLSPACVNIIENLLLLVPTDRLGIPELLQHPWVKKDPERPMSPFKK